MTAARLASSVKKKRFYYADGFKGHKTISVFWWQLFQFQETLISSISQCHAFRIRREKTLTSILACFLIVIQSRGKLSQSSTFSELFIINHKFRSRIINFHLKNITKTSITLRESVASVGRQNYLKEKQ